MSQKTLIFIIVAILFGLLAGGGIVYLFTKNTPTRTITTSSLSSLSTIELATSSSSSIATITSSSSSPNTSSTVAKVEFKGKKFLGWIGSLDTEVYLNFDKDKITGKYYNNIDKKWFDLSGSYLINQDKTTGNINLDEFDGGLITGHMSFFGSDNGSFFNQEESQKGSYNQTYNGIAAGNYYNQTFSKLNGTYIDVKNTPNDLYLYSNEADFKAVTPITKTLEYVKSLPGNDYETATAFFRDGTNYYFTKEVWKLPKDLKATEKVKIEGKLRNYYNTKYVELKTEPYEYQVTNQGFFQVVSISKI